MEAGGLVSFLIRSDFKRLVEGKALFDGDALEAIVNAPDNNARAKALETFADAVLPFYDDLPSVYPQVVERLIVAADVSRVTRPIAIETPYGSLPAKTFANILRLIVKIFERYRYVQFDVTFEALRTLYGWAAAEEERKPLLELGISLSRHDLSVWQQYDPSHKWLWTTASTNSVTRSDVVLRSS